MTQPKKIVYLMHNYVLKQVFYDVAKTLIFDPLFPAFLPEICICNAFLRGKAGFLITRPKTRCIFDAFLLSDTCFLVTLHNRLYLMHFTWKSMFSHDAPKTDASVL